MPLSRRFLLTAPGMLPLSRLPSAMAAPVTSRRDLRDPLASLQAFVDTLIPRDDAPSGSDLGVDRKIADKAATAKPYHRLLVFGCAWIDQRARSLDAGIDGFRDLSEKGRIRVVELAEAEPGKEVGRVFVRIVRADALRFYYADPRAWTALGYNGPPQPAGFPDFAQPPAERKP